MIYNHMEVKDMEGIIRIIPLSSLHEMKLFGMGMGAILELRNQYLRRNGREDITRESILEIWG